MEGRKAILVRIHGKVQGVSFRVWTQAEAEKLRLTGWVRNEKDGTVTALVAGSDAAVFTMLQRLHQGPPGASVSSVTSEAVDVGEVPDNFNITS